MSAQRTTEQTATEQTPTVQHAGWRLGPGVKWLDDTTLAGGAPYRVMTLTDRGAGIVHGLLTGTAAPETTLQPAVAELLDRLEAAGLLRAPAPPAADHRGITLVIPARSAPGPLRELLRLLPADLPVIIVDDGSAEPLASLATERANLQVLRHNHSRGPAAARNAGAALVRTPWIAFLDADTLPDENWLGAMMGHLRPPAPSAERVVLAAPRIYPLPGTGTAAWFEERVCALDLGGAPADVGVGKAVSYVPSAALLVDADAFRRVGGFDESMEVGEDVDLVWRIAEFGRVRYLPDVRVGHRPRGSLSAALDRRRVYGMSAADLGRRHPGALRHVDVSVWSFAPWLLGVLVHPLLGVAAGAVTAAIAPWGMPTLSPKHARTLAVQGHLRAGGALGRWLIRPMLPATIVAGLLSPRVGRRLLVSAAAGLGYLVVMDVRSARLANSPAAAVRMAAESLVARTLDDAAYSLGVWQGVLTQRTLEPVLPKVRDLPGWPRRRKRARRA